MKVNNMTSFFCPLTFFAALPQWAESPKRWSLRRIITEYILVFFTNTRKAQQRNVTIIKSCTFIARDVNDTEAEAKTDTRRCTDEAVYA